MLPSLLSIILIIQLSISSIEAQNVCDDLSLTINAVSNKLELNWDFTRNCDVDLPNLIKLIHLDEQGNEEDLQTISIRSSPKGYQLTDVEFIASRFPGNWNEDDEDEPLLSSHCYPYLIRSIRDEAVVSEKCLKIEPAWMQDFGPLRLGNLMIPGTHKSGVGGWSGKPTGLPERYAFTQELNFWGQLVSGIRYFDINVGYFKNINPNLWINSGLIFCTMMAQEFQHIARFLERSPREVVILHINSFEYPSAFTEEFHTAVINLIQSNLGEYILPPDGFTHPEGPTLQEIWNNNPARRLIVSYNQDQVIEQVPWIWHNIKYKSETKTKGIDLFNYLNIVKSDHDHPNSPFCVLSATLTPSLLYIMRNPDKSLRYIADEVNPDISTWLKLDGWVEDVNIITTDFFMGNNVIDIAIETNRNRLLRI